MRLRERLREQLGVGQVQEEQEVFTHCSEQEVPHPLHAAVPALMFQRTPGGRFRTRGGGPIQLPSRSSSRRPTGMSAPPLKTLLAQPVDGKAWSRI